jgi:hypothetical protein
MMSSLQHSPAEAGLSRRSATIIVLLAMVMLLSQVLPLFGTRWVADESWYTAPAHNLVTQGKLRMEIFAPPSNQSMAYIASTVLILVLAAFIKILGASLYVARLPYLLSALAAIYLVYRLGRELESEALGALAAVLMAVDNMFFLAARTARPESMVTMLWTASILLFLVARRRQSARLALLSGLLVGLGALVHVNTLPAGITAGIFALVEFRSSIIRRIRPWAFLVGLLVPVIVYVAWCAADPLRWREFAHGYGNGQGFPLSQIPAIELSRWSDFIGMPNSRFKMPIPVPYRLHVAVALLAAVAFLYRLNRKLLTQIACMLIPMFVWWAFIRNQNVRYTAVAAPCFALLVAGATLAIWNWRPAWRKAAMAVTALLIVAQVGSNYALLYLYRKADYIEMTRQFHRIIPPDASVYGGITLWMAFVDQPFFSYTRTPLPYALEHGANYLILGDRNLVSGNGWWGIDDWQQVRVFAEQFAREQATLVGEVPNSYYGDMKVYRVNNPKPPRPRE